MIRQLIRRFLREQDGIALVMAIAAMSVLAIATTGVIVSATANEETALVSTEGRSAFGVAQEALAYGEGLVYADVANGTDPVNDTPYPLPAQPNSATGTYSVHSDDDVTWQVTGTGMLGGVTRTVSAYVTPAQTVTTQQFAIWNYLSREQRQPELHIGWRGDKHADPHGRQHVPERLHDEDPQQSRGRREPRVERQRADRNRVEPDLQARGHRHVRRQRPSEASRHRPVRRRPQPHLRDHSREHPRYDPVDADGRLRGRLRHAGRPHENRLPGEPLRQEHDAEQRQQRQHQQHPLRQHGLRLFSSARTSSGGITRRSSSSPTERSISTGRTPPRPSATSSTAAWRRSTSQAGSSSRAQAPRCAGSRAVGRGGTRRTTCSSSSPSAGRTRPAPICSPTAASPSVAAPPCRSAST